MLPTQKPPVSPSQPAPLFSRRPFARPIRNLKTSPVKRITFFCSLSNLMNFFVLLLFISNNKIARPSFQFPVSRCHPQGSHVPNPGLMTKSAHQKSSHCLSVRNFGIGMFPSGNEKRLNYKAGTNNQKLDFFGGKSKILSYATLGTRSERKTGLCGKNFQTGEGGLTPTHFLVPTYQVIFGMPK